MGDADVAHCSGMTRAVGSGNVFANGIRIEQGDGILLHLPLHTLSTTCQLWFCVFVNGKGCGRVGIEYLVAHLLAGLLMFWWLTDK